MGKTKGTNVVSLAPNRVRASSRHKVDPTYNNNDTRFSSFLFIRAHIPKQFSRAVVQIMISEFGLKLVLTSICIGNAIAMVSTDSVANAASNVSFNSSSENGTSTARQGWTSSPNGRGTVDIIWQCSSTIFLCCWTVLCLNVPSSPCHVTLPRRLATFPCHRAG